MPREWDEIKDIFLPEIGMTLAELRFQIEQSQQQLKAIKKLHETYAHSYTTAERAVAYGQGLVHSEDESNALNAIIDTSDKFPEHVTSLAAQDKGVDDDAFETPLIAARLEATKILQKIAQNTQNLADIFLDTAAHVGQKAKPTLGAAYRILKPIASVLEAVHSSLSPAIDFFRTNKGRPRKPK